MDIRMIPPGAATTAGIGSLVLTAALLSCIASASAEPRFSFATTPGKLPKDVVPKHYALRIVPAATYDRFDAEALIDIEVARPVRAIVVNAAELSFKSVRLRAGTGDETSLAPSFDPQLETVALTPAAAPIAPGSYRLGIEDSGKIREHPQGLDQIAYKERGRGRPSQKLMLGTQMVPVQARPLVSGRHKRLNGKLGRDRLERRPLPVRPRRGFAAPEAGGLRHHRARDRAPMDRQPRHDGLVGQLVAERGPRLVDGGQGLGALQSRLGHAAARCALERPGPVGGRAQDDPSDPDAGRERHARDGRLRCRNVRQRGPGPAHARGVSRRRRFSRRRARLRARASLFQYDHRRLLAPPVGSIATRHRQAGRGLDGAARIPGRESPATV